MRSLNSPNNQRGVATLLVSVIILLVLAIMTLYTNRSVIIEQRSATNEFKQAQALEAAQSGLATFMGQLAGSDADSNWNKYFSQSGSTITLKSAYANTLNSQGYLNTTDGQYSHNFSTGKPAMTVALAKPKDNAGNTLNNISQGYKVFIASTGTPNQFTLISQGCSDSTNCNEAYAEAFVATDFTLGASAICPLDINGSLTVVSGGSVHGLVDSMPGFDCGISVGSASGSLGDVIGCESGSCNAGDAGNYNPPYQVTGSTGKDAHFQKYWGTTQATKQAQMLAASTASTKTACYITGNATQANLKTCTDAGLSQIYITGDLNITAATPWAGYSFPKGLELIVGGDLNLVGASFSMYGILYVVGNTGSSLDGAFHAIGNAAFAGNVTANLSFNVTADTRYTKVPAGSSGVKSNLTLGSWRDF
ncbi:PilX N-terminal domain-containing pilus assembly protein [Chitinibacter sp. GC72]|uniref:pilus assembly PilX family protein n=1 Tax=Chitinibacter sp. GC72 TaxID=1526917 RepID=UPI0012F7A183|nr:PilX N-terminal domain-containing pilus assembly protein [Chitinibacter sp. GC72]